MDYKSKFQSRPGPTSYLTQSKTPQIYEPILKSKEDKTVKPLNGGSYSNISKNPQSVPSKNQEDIDAFELAQAQRSLRLLKSKMSVTPKQTINQYNGDDNEEEPQNFQAFNRKVNQNSEPIIDSNDTKSQNSNYRKVFKPTTTNSQKEENNQYQKRNEEPNYIKMTKNTATNSSAGIKKEELKANSPISQPSKLNERKPYEKKSALEEIQNDEYFASKKAAPKLQNKESTTGASKLSSKNANMKPTAEEYEYYDKNTRHYSNYMYQENVAETNNIQDSKNIRGHGQKPPNNTASENTNKIGNFQKIPTNSNDNPNSKINSVAQTKTSSTNSNSYNTNSKPGNSYNKNKYAQEEPEEEEEQNPEEEEENNEEEDNNEDNDEEEDNEEGERKIGGSATNVDEYGDPGQMIQCTMGCGRKFNADAIKKHMKICKKVFQGKRKVFDSSKARTDGVLPPEKAVGKMKGKPNANTNKNAGNGKKNKWKNQSEAFRNMLKQARGNPLSEQEEKNLKNTFEEAQDLTMCNFCGRKFNDAAAKKHIPFCENKTRMEKIKQNQGRNGKR